MKKTLVTMLIFILLASLSAISVAAAAKKKLTRTEKLAKIHARREKRIAKKKLKAKRAPFKRLLKVARQKLKKERIAHKAIWRPMMKQSLRLIGEIKGSQEQLRQNKHTYNQQIVQLSKHREDARKIFFSSRKEKLVAINGLTKKINDLTADDKDKDKNKKLTALKNEKKQLRDEISKIKSTYAQGKIATAKSKKESYAAYLENRDKIKQQLKENKKNYKIHRDKVRKIVKKYRHTRRTLNRRKRRLVYRLKKIKLKIR